MFQPPDCRPRWTAPAGGTNGSFWPSPKTGNGPYNKDDGILRALLPHLQAERVRLARDSEASGAEVAVLVSDRGQLRQALLRLADERPDLVVRLGIEWRAVATIPIGTLGHHHIASADWLSVGGRREHGTYGVGTSGHLRIQLVEYDPDRNRYLALNPRASRVDWTPLFATDQASGTRRWSVPAGTRRLHRAAPVDVVYTWVDAGDRQWREEYRRYHEGHHADNPSADNEERYLDRGELRYSLRSLWTFARFVRRIYLVTADQRPAWLDPRNPRITLVSHRDIFPDPAALPTFNSHAIEACLHRIRGLSEHFLYLNDDVFFGREVAEEDFYTSAGLAKVRFSPSQFIYQGPPERSAIPTDWAAYNSVSLVARDFGTTFDRRVQHVPLPLRRSVLTEIEERYPAEVARTRSARFRAVTDLAIPSMHAQFYGIATARAVEWPTRRNDYIYLDTGRYDSLSRFREILSRRPTFFCLNTTRYSEIDHAAQATHLREFLAPAFPTPAPWELPPGCASDDR
jgi:hypothetical protein